MTKRANTDFVGGMFSGVEKCKGKTTFKYADCAKAKEIIKKTKNLREAELGLAEDWNNTAGTVFEDGKFVNDDYCYLNSMWATPILVLVLEDGTEKRDRLLEKMHP
jgi:hypothetical protein